jgi:hypothetical protein
MAGICNITVQFVYTYSVYVLMYSKISWVSGYCQLPDVVSLTFTIKDDI